MKRIINIIICFTLTTNFIYSQSKIDKKVNNLINLNYTYIIFGKEKAYGEYNDSLFEKMKKSFKRMDGIKLWKLLTAW